MWQRCLIDDLHDASDRLVLARSYENVVRQPSSVMQDTRAGNRHECDDEEEENKGRRLQTGAFSHIPRPRK